MPSIDAASLMVQRSALLRDTFAVMSPRMPLTMFLIATAGIPPM
jgi:hypothetical protein